MESLSGSGLKWKVQRRWNRAPVPLLFEDFIQQQR